MQRISTVSVDRGATTRESAYSVEVEAMRAATASCGARPDCALIQSRPEKEHEMSGSEEKLSRGLKQRHLTMIAIGGVIGAGLFVGSGVVISNT